MVVGGAIVTRVTSYWALLGLAIQSSRWEQAMNRNLVEMGTFLNQAATLQASASEQQALAAQSDALSSSLEGEAIQLQKEAEVLMTKSRTDAGAAGMDEAAVVDLDAKIESEQEEVAAHAGLAATEEATADAEAAEAAADATEAARIEAQAHGEEIGIALCELVPILDVACDVIGGVTAVGLEAGAAAEAVKAASEVAAAAASKADEEREIGLSGELEGQVAEDVVVADKLKKEGLELESQSKEEQLAAEEKETAAQGLLEKADEEEALAVDEEAAATDAETESVVQAGKAIESGVMASWNGIMSCLCGMVSFSFFLFRFCVNFVIPATGQLLNGMAKIRNPGDGIVVPTHSICRDASYVFHHIAIFFVVASTFQDLLAVLGQNSLRARGGIILCFAMVGGVVQTFFLHILPSGVARVEYAWELILHFVRRMLVLPVLFTIEILTLWVLFGRNVFVKCDFERLGLLLLWISLGLSLLIHISLIETPRLRRRKKGPACTAVHDDASSKVTTHGQGRNETDSLLPSKARQPPQPSKEKTWLSQLWEDIQSLHLPLEVLILACLFVIIFHSITSTRLLWPASRALLIRSHPPWLLPVAIGISVALLSLCIASVWFG